MAARKSILKITDKIRTFSSIRRSLTVGKIIYSKSTGPASTSGIIPDVPGLSAAVVKVSKESVGPGATKSGEYKNPEYFCYDKTSYFEAEIEILKYRCPQPSTKVRYEQK